MITDIDSLRQRIFERGHSNISYLIMNNDTRYRLMSMFPGEYILKSNGGLSYAEIYDVPIAICEKVKNGEIEVI